MSCFSGLMAGGLPSAILCYQKTAQKTDRHFPFNGICFHLN
ncbi:MAG: hypothetical protein E6X91_08560 [Haemophilus parainfluenzae]|nr:hypothetical protein [Haemophilus parainfluenzae]MDU7656234.1 hypothetical protein [Haemophilus parainfluenzae]